MRDYDATLGRYIQADPLGSVDGASVYGYALQNPARWSDPRGEQSTADASDAAILAAIAAGGAAVSEAYDACMANPACSDIMEHTGKSTTEALQYVVGMLCSAALPLFVESKSVDPKQPPNHPDFKSAKKRPGLEQIPWMGPGRKGYPDKSGNYWEPVVDGHKGTHAPHLDTQHPNGQHTPKYRK